MGVVDLDHGIISQVVKVAASFHTFVQDQAGAVADHEILLVDTQQPAVVIAVIGIQEQSQVLLDIGLVKGDAGFYDIFIDGLDVEQVQLIDTVFISDHIDVIQTGSEDIISDGDLVADIRFVQPGIRFDPGIGGLLLEMVLKDLLEQSQVIVQPDAVPWKP